MLPRIFLTFIVSFLGFISSAQALDVQDIRFGEYPDRTRLVLDLDRPSEYRAAILADPNRLVLDMPDFKWTGPALHSIQSKSVSSIRLGILEPGVTRLVFDLNAPITIENTFALPKSDSKTDRIVIDFKSSTQGALEAQSKKLYGDFETAKSPDIDRVLQGALDPSQNKTPPAPRTAKIFDTKFKEHVNIPQAPPGFKLLKGIPVPGRKPAFATNTEKTVQKPPQKQATPEPVYKSQRKPLIIIDPGHGGKDPGAVSKDRKREKDVVLSLSKSLKKELEKTGRYRVKLTREGDYYIRLRDRVKFAREHGADLFISVHADSLPKSTARGASVYTLSEKASDAQTAKLAARENNADLIAGVNLSVEDDEVADILLDLATRDTMNQSKFFANTLVTSLRNQGVKTLSNTHRYAGFAVLKAPDIPSVLVEAGFMSNAAEAALLTRERYQKQIAAALAKGIAHYFETVERNLNQ